MDTYELPAGTEKASSDKGESPHEGVRASTSLTSLVRATLSRLSTLVEQIQNSPYHTSSDLFSDEEGRFMLWAGKKYLRGDDQALEWRLSQSSHVQRSTASTLERLDEVVVSSIVGGLSPNRCDDTERSSQELALLSSQKIAQALRGTQSDRARGSTEIVQQTTEFAELFLNLRSANTHLLSLSTLLRRESPRPPARGPVRAAIDPKDELATFRRNFPAVEAWLARRICRQIVQRRHWIVYRQIASLTTKNSVHESKASAEKDFSSSSHPVSKREENDSQFDGSRHSFLRGYEALRSLSAGPATTQRTPRIVLRENLGTYTDISVQPTPLTHGDVIVDSVRTLPKLDKLCLNGVPLRYNTKIECPFCRTSQFLKNEEEWEFHLFSDLKLFTCTSVTCDSLAFRSEKEWFQHEVEEHRRCWMCHMCGKSYRSEISFLTHLKVDHGNEFPAKQESTLLEACSKPQALFYELDCPFCYAWKVPHPRTNDNAAEFSAHVGSHFRWIALQALPRMIQGLEYNRASTAFHVPRDHFEGEQTGVERVGLSPPSTVCSSDSEHDEAGVSSFAPTVETSVAALSANSLIEVNNSRVAVRYAASPPPNQHSCTRADEQEKTNMSSWFGGVDDSCGKAVCWVCHCCGDGPFLVATTVSCLVCQHEYCSGCREASEYPYCPLFGDMLPDEFDTGLVVQRNSLFH